MPQQGSKLYHHTGVQGLYVRREDIDGRIIVQAGPQENMKKIWDSAWGPNSSEVDGTTHSGTPSVLGLMLPREARSSYDFIKILWKARGQPGMTYLLGPFTDIEKLWLESQPKISDDETTGPMEVAIDDDDDDDAEVDNSQDKGGLRVQMPVQNSHEGE